MATYLLTTHWTHGDVIPFVQIGGELKTRGHRVILVTHDYFKSLVLEAGLEFVSWDDTEDWGNTLYYLKLGADPISDPQGRLRFYHAYWNNRKILAEYEILKSVIETIDDELVLCSRFRSDVAALLAAEIYNLPVVTVVLAPSFFDQIECEEAIYGEFLREERNKLRGGLGLKEISRWKAWMHSPGNPLCLWPAWFAQANPYWPQVYTCAGFLRAEPKNEELSPEIVAFLSAGGAPVLICGGTSSSVSGEFYSTAIRACQLAGQRMIILTMYRELLPAELTDDMMWASYIPLEEILPKISCFINHGGIGTVSRGIYAAVPQLILAHHIDRPANGKNVKRLGLGDCVLKENWEPELCAGVLEKLIKPEAKHFCEEFAGLNSREEFDDGIAPLLESLAGNDDCRMSEAFFTEESVPVEAKQSTQHRKSMILKLIREKSGETEKIGNQRGKL